MLTNEASASLVNARLYENLERRVREISMLNEATRSINSTLDFRETLDLVTRRTRDLLQVDIVSIALMENDGEHLRFITSAGPSPQRIHGRKMRKDQGFAGWVIRNRQSLIVNDVQNDPRHYSRFDIVTDFATHSILCVPLQIKNRISGVINAINKSNGPFDPEDMRLMESIAATAATAIEHARLFTASREENLRRRQVEKALEDERRMLSERISAATAVVEKQNERERSLAAIEPTLSHPQELSTSLQKIVAVAETGLSADAGAAIVLWDEAAREFDASVLSKKVPVNDGGGVKWQSGGLSERIRQEQRTIIIADALADNTAEVSVWTRRNRLRTIVGAPLVGQGECWGILYVLHFQVASYTPEDIDYLNALANRAAVAIANVQLYENLQHTNSMLARAAEMKDQFLAGMSHELRTPLNAILGLAEGLQEQYYGPLNEKQQKSVQIIGESGSHLLDLINDILDVAKVEAGEMQLDVDWTSARIVCESSLNFIKRMAAKKKITIHQSIDENVRLVPADSRRLKQILTNLLSNAVKFTPDSGDIGVDVYPEAGSGMVCFTIWDTGIGIAEKDLSRLFEPFVQLDSALFPPLCGHRAWSFPRETNDRTAWWSGDGGKQIGRGQQVLRAAAGGNGSGEGKETAVRPPLPAAGAGNQVEKPITPTLGNRY